MDKSPDAFRTISEVAEDLDLPQHVLRFWETRFSQIRPLKRGGGRRYYRPDDVDLLKGIRHLLYGEGYTIKGVQRILKTEGVRFVQGVGRGEETVTAPPPETPAESAEEAVALAATPEEILPHAALQRLRGALDELREADRVLSTLDASEPLRE
jgi:DNA-binding transcriptional MerR regulator